MLHHILLFIAILSLSQAANLVRYAAAPVEVIGFWRLLMASLILAPLAFKHRHSVKAATGKVLSLTFLSGVFLFLHFGTFFFAAQNTKIANAMILFATNPLFTAAGAYFFFKEKISLRLAIAYVLAGFGIYFLVSHSITFDPERFKGDISALISAAFFSGYILTGRAVRPHYENTLYTFIIYLTTGVLFGVACLFTGVAMTSYPTHSWIAIATLAIVTTLFGHALFTYLLSHMSVNFLSCAKLVEPVFSALVAYFVFQESLANQTLTAFIFTAAAILTLYWPTKKKPA